MWRSPGRWQDGPYQLQQIVGNALGTPSVTTSATVAAAAGDRMACKLSSSAITCSVNGTVVASSVNSFNATARNVGFAAGTGAPARFDELRDEP